MNKTLSFKDGGLAVNVTDSSGAMSDGYTLTGYASTFGNVDSLGDVVRSGAFLDSLKSWPSVPILWQHEPKAPIGKTTLLAETPDGLIFKGMLVPTIQGRDAAL